MVKLSSCVLQIRSPRSCRFGRRQRRRSRRRIDGRNWRRSRQRRKEERKMQSQQPLLLQVLEQSESPISSLLLHHRHPIPHLIEILHLRLPHPPALSDPQVREVILHPLHDLVSYHRTSLKRVTLLTKHPLPLRTLFVEQPLTSPSRNHPILHQPTPSPPTRLLPLLHHRHLQNRQISLLHPHLLHDSPRLSTLFHTNDRQVGLHIWQ